MKIIVDEFVIQIGAKDNGPSPLTQLTELIQAPGFIEMLTGLFGSRFPPPILAMETPCGCHKKAEYKPTETDLEFLQILTTLTLTETLDLADATLNGLSKMPQWDMLKQILNTYTPTEIFAYIEQHKDTAPFGELFDAFCGEAPCADNLEKFHALKKIVNEL